jgi:hypothetical protein
MTSISYDDIFGSFLENITDYELASKSISEAYSIMSGYLHKALTNMYIHRLFTECKLNDDIQMFEYEIKHVVNDDIDREFIITILGKGMVQAWVSPKVQSIMNIMQMMSDKEKTIYSQSAHLKELQELKSNIETEIQRQIDGRGFVYNSYLEG